MEACGCGEEQIPWMYEEAAQILDARLDLARESARWNVASFGTLTLAALAAAATLAFTGFTWWFTAPLSMAAVFLWLTVTSVNATRRVVPPPTYRQRDDDPPATAG